jgi:hypothetical protein
MEAIILDYSLFDDGGIEYKTFCVATPNDSFVCEYSYIQTEYPQYIPLIKAAMLVKKSYIVTEFGEIQWD